MAYKPVQKIYFANQTALLQIYAHLFGVCFRGFQKARFFRRFYTDRVANFKMQPLLQGGIRPCTREGFTQPERLKNPRRANRRGTRK